MRPRSALRCAAVLGLLLCVAALCRAATIPVPGRPPDLRPRVTGYQPHQTVANCGRDNSPHIDGLGGGPNAAWTGKRLEDWHCAVAQHGTRAVPYGTILVIGHPVNRVVVAVDCGPGVRSNQIDVCFVWASAYRRFDRANTSGRANAWIIGRLGRAEARRWTPTRAAVIP